MSRGLVAVGILASLLVFYLLVISLAQLKLFRANHQLARQLHFGGWGLTLLLFVGFISLSISLRGQWLDVVPFGLSWLAASVYFWLRRKHLRGVSRFYFGAWFCYPAGLALAYLADKIFFVLVSLPLLAFLPTPTYYSSPTVTLRDPVSGFLAARRVQLLVPLYFVFEKHVGLTDETLLAAGDSITSVRLQPSWQPDSVSALISTRRGQHLVKFGPAR